MDEVQIRAKLASGKSEHLAPPNEPSPLMKVILAEHQKSTKKNVKLFSSCLLIYIRIELKVCNV